MIDKLRTLSQLLLVGTQKEQRPLLLIVVVLCLVGLIIAVGAAYPILSPFLYAMF